MQDGSPDETLVMDLAAELADKFSVESLEMYDALQEVWSNANKSDFAAKRNAAKVCVSEWLDLVCVGEMNGCPHSLHFQGCPVKGLKAGLERWW